MKSYVELQFEYAEIGDMVWHINYGWGIIIKKIQGIEGNITVQFSLDIDEFRYSGYVVKNKYSPNDVQVLYWDEFKIQKPPIPGFVLDRI